MVEKAKPSFWEYYNPEVFNHPDIKLGDAFRLLLSAIAANPVLNDDIEQGENIYDEAVDSSIACAKKVYDKHASVRWVKIPNPEFIGHGNKNSVDIGLLEAYCVKTFAEILMSFNESNKGSIPPVWVIKSLVEDQADSVIYLESDNG